MRVRYLFMLTTLAAMACVLFSTVMVDANSMTIESQVRAGHLSKSVPGQLNYQGFLVDAADSSAVTAILEMTFRLFDSETKGAELWSETHPAVEVNSGIFHVLLGSVTAFPAGLFDGSTRWLQTEVGGEVLVPRKPLVSAAYSQRAEMADHASTAYEADFLEGQNLTDLDDRWVNTEDQDHLNAADGDPANALSVDDDGKVGIGTASPLTELDVSGSVNATTYYGDGSNLTGISGTTDNDWIIDGNDVYHETGNVGIGTDSPAHPLDVQGIVNTDSIYAIGGSKVLSAAGSENIFVGIGAGENSSGGWLTFVGQDAGRNNQASWNTFYGCLAGTSNTTGSWNTFLGVVSGLSNTEGNWNTFVGMSTGESNTTGDGNTFLGISAGELNTTGSWNTFLGNGAGGHNIDGSNNVFIGKQAGYNETSSNKLYIANGPDSGNVLIYGDFSTGQLGIGTTSPSQTLDVDGAVNAATYYGDGSNLTGISGTTDNDWTIDGDDVYRLTGKVGIGTTTPAAKLDIQGTLNVGQDDSGYDVNLYGSESGSRLFWDEDKKALRAGWDYTGTDWLPDSIGLCSFAAGFRVKASRPYSTALGYNSVASGDYSTAIGNHTKASGANSLSMGYLNTASGSISIAMGSWLAASAPWSIVLGKGESDTAILTNNVARSLMVGFDTTIPTLFVGGDNHRVGIGTTSPAAKLDVNGAINTDSVYSIGGDAVLSTRGIRNVFVGPGAGTNNTGIETTLLGYNAGHNNGGQYNVFVGLKAGEFCTGGWWNTFLGAFAGILNSSGGGNTFVGEAAGHQNDTGSRNTYLGMGAGYNNAAGDSNVFIGHRAGYDEIGSNKLYIANDRDTSDVLIYGDFSTGRVGLGTLNPGQKLHIAGHQLIQGSDGFDSSGDQATLYLGDTAKYLRATYGGVLALYSNDPISIRTFADSSQLHLKTNGRVGVGTDNPTRKFWVNGDAGGTGAWYNDSDERLKQDISTIEGALDKVQRLRGVNFRWRDTKHHPEGAQVGLIAQEVAEVVPEVVDKKGEYYSLATANLVPVLIEAVKEQQRAIEEQASKIAELQARLDALR